MTRNFSSLRLKQSSAMFNLNDSLRYFLYSEPTDMRKSFHTLAGIVRNAMGQNPCDGSVYIFLNRPRNRIKLLHWEAGGMVLYSKMLEEGTFTRPPNQENSTVQSMEWRNLVVMVEGIIANADSRKRRLDSLNKMRK